VIGLTHHRLGQVFAISIPGDGKRTWTDVGLSYFFLCMHFTCSQFYEINFYSSKCFALAVVRGLRYCYHFLFDIFDASFNIMFKRAKIILHYL